MDSTMRIMDVPVIERANSKQRRSRNGCQECRRLHRKCSESRPACTNCVIMGKTCTYAKSLSWGGRPFQKSCFGATEAVKVNIYDTVSGDGGSSKKQPFVYSMRKPTANPISQPITSDLEPNTAPSEIFMNPDWLSNLSETQQSLLHGFFQHTIRSFSTHPTMHEKLGSTLLPMSLQGPDGSHLLSAILYASTLHRTSSNTVTNQEQMLALKYNSIRLLRQQIDGHDNALLDVRIATSLVLCLAEVIAGSEQSDSWHTHLRGALAMLRMSYGDGHHCCREFIQTHSARVVLARWCRSFQLLAVLAGCSDQSSEVEELQVCCIDDPHLDMFSGFSTRLIPIFREIDQALKSIGSVSSPQIADHDSMSVPSIENVVAQYSFDLADQIDAMLSNPVMSLDPWIAPSQRSHNMLNIFQVVDQTYHYAALLQVFQSIGMTCTDVQIVSTVDAMIQCFQEITLNEGPDPGVATLYPIFIAGCNSSEPNHRTFVLDWMSEMTKLFAMGNVDRSRRFLIDLWNCRDARAYAEPYVTWHSFHSEFLMSLGMAEVACVFN